MEAVGSNSVVTSFNGAQFGKTTPTKTMDQKRAQPSSQTKTGPKTNGNGGNPGGSASKRKKQDAKTGKGLRHFSMKVCEKVRQKGVTSYNEVADELVAEFSADPGASRADMDSGEPFDQKNIRRRVYDALNVLMAINIISKEKKEIKWIGLPTNAQQERTELERERAERIQRINQKKHQLHEAIIQQIAFKNLIDRNTDQKDLPDPNSIIKMPFIIVNTDKNTMIDCSISRDRSEYLFNFDNTFEIHDDIEVLKRMGLARDLDKSPSECTLSAEDHRKALSFIPDYIRPHYEEMLKEKKVKIT